MGKKVICETCGTIFKEEIVQDAVTCPVCGASFDDDEKEAIRINTENDTQTEIDETADNLMYFDEIMIFKEKPEYNNVNAYCTKCGADNSLELENFDELIDKDHVTLKKEITVKCQGCGLEHKPRKILYRPKDHYAPPRPRCPICNSAMLKKITIGSKFLAAATLGSFALPYNSKTYECKNCGYRF